MFHFCTIVHVFYFVLLVVNETNILLRSQLICGREDTLVVDRTDRVRLISLSHILCALFEYEDDKKLYVLDFK